MNTEKNPAAKKAVKCQCGTCTCGCQSNACRCQEQNCQCGCTTPAPTR